MLGIAWQHFFLFVSGSRSQAVLMYFTSTNEESFQLCLVNDVSSLVSHPMSRWEQVPFVVVLLIYGYCSMLVCCNVGLMCLWCVVFCFYFNVDCQFQACFWGFAIGGLSSWRTSFAWTKRLSIWSNRAAFEEVNHSNMQCFKGFNLPFRNQKFPSLNIFNSADFNQWIDSKHYSHWSFQSLADASGIRCAAWLRDQVFREYHVM